MYCIPSPAMHVHCTLGLYNFQILPNLLSCLHHAVKTCGYFVLKYLLDIIIKSLVHVYIFSA